MVDAARVGGSTPSFQHSLGLLGQYLNKHNASRVTIAEVDTGFLLYYFTNARWTKPISVPVQHTELLELTGTVAGNTLGKDGIIIKGGDRRDKKHPLCPMGYDVFLRAVGIRLDRRAAVGVAICETRDRFYVNYWVDKATFVIRDGRRQAVSTVQMETFDADGVKRLLQATSEAQAQEMIRYERGLKVNPHDYLSIQDAGFMFEDDGNYREAEALFNKVAAAVPQHPEIHYHIARLALMRGDKRTASAAIKRTLKHRADEAPVQDLYGRILRQTGNLKGAIGAFERAVEIDPDHGIYHYHLSQAYEAAGRTEDAAAEMALSTSQTAAPAWDMVQEDIAIEVSPAVAQPRLEQLPAQAALLPPVAAVGAFGSSPPVMTTDFGPSESSWPSTGGDTSWTATAMKLTTFDELPPAPFIAPDPAAPPPMTLEQRMQAARGLAIHADRGSAPEPSPSAAPASMPSLSDMPATAYVAPIEHVQPIEPMHQAQVAAPVEPAPVDVREVAPIALESVPVAEPRRPQRVTRAERPVDPAPPPVPTVSAPEPPPVAAASVPAVDAPQPATAEEAPSAGAVELAAEIMMIQRALDSEPNRADLHRKLGFLLARQGKTAEAATEFRKALQASRTSL